VSRLKDDRGSALVFIVIFMIGLWALLGVVLDAGSWYRAQRHVQAAADAAALAGAQDLPDTSTATSSATTYANDNVSDLDAWSPMFPDSATIDVKLSKPAPGFFAELLGISSVTVHGHARAQVGTPGSLKNVAPIAIKASSACTSDSSGCFGTPKRVTFDDTTTTTFSSSTTFGLLDLGGSSTNSAACSGNVGQADQAGWIRSGYPGLLGVNRYYGATTGQRIALRNALADMLGEILLIPVFDTANKSWCTAGGFHVIGWAAFVVESIVDWRPSVKTITGHFVVFIAHDVESTPGVPGFGVKVIALIQ
jgi:hypothetical protein